MRLRRCQKLLAQHRRLNRCSRTVPKSERTTASEITAQGALIGMHNFNDVLNSDAIVSLRIVAGLVRREHAQLEAIAFESTWNRRRILVHVQIGTDAVTGAVAIVEADVPKCPTGHRIEEGVLVRTERAMLKLCNTKRVLRTSDSPLKYDSHLHHAETLLYSTQ